MSKKLYLVGVIIKEKEIEISTLGIKTDLKLSWADGMIGVLPVFDSPSWERGDKKYEN